MPSKKIILAAAVAALAVLNAMNSLGAQEPGEKTSPSLEEGIGQFKHENYEEALPLLKKAREEDPKSTIAAYYLGLTYKQLQNYKEAIVHLKDAVTYLPKIKGALIELVDCLYQTGRTGEAKKWIEEAEEEGIRPAQVSFLKGMVLLKEDNTSEAIAAFENAKALDASMKQAADYQIGIAYLKEKRFPDAENAFKEVVILDPNSNMANFANEYMSALTKKERLAKPLKMSVGIAYQYDDNVILKPSDATLAANVAEEADFRQAYTLKAEYDKRFEDALGLKGQYSLYYARQNDLGFYDVLSNGFTVQPSFYSKESLLGFPTGYTHTMVNEKSYLSSTNTGVIYNHMAGSSNMAQCFLNYQYRDYLWTPASASENRDGNDLGGGLGWYFFYAKNKGFLNLRYALNKDWAKRNNWEYLGNRASATVLIPIKDRLNFSVTGDFFWQGFSNTHTVYNEKRDDKIYTVSPLVAWEVFKDAELQLQYTHVTDDSNLGVYKYDRNIYSAGMEFKF